MRLVLDTSTVVAAVRSPFGASKLLIEAAFRLRFTPLMSAKLAIEYESVLKRPEHLPFSNASEAEVDNFIDALLRIAIHVELQPYFGPYSIDPGDNHVLSLAKHGRADAIVTHNTRHFLAPANLLGVNLYSPADALNLIGRS